MQQIEQGIYISNNYPGVTLGAVSLPYGTLFIDTPPHPDDGRAWLSLLRSLGNGVGRLVVALDAHPDRSIGIRALDTPTLVHAEAADIFSNRPAIFKAHYADTGAEWEQCEGLNGIRWAKPSLFFTEKAILEWGDQTLLVEHHPGPSPGASWIVIPDASVVFIGDAVPVNQPPFLVNADIDAWVDSLDELLAKEYKDFLFVSSRGGLVEETDIREMRRFLKEVQKRLERLAERDADVEETAKMVSNLLTRFDFPKQRQKMYAQRLESGLRQYYINHYRPIESEKDKDNAS